MSDEVFTLHDGEGLRAQFSAQGARWLSCRVLGREVLLGPGRVQDPPREPGMLGAICGRFAGRIGEARFTLDGREHRLLANEGSTCLNGGPDGFHRRHWAARQLSDRELRLSLHSPEGDQGFPGAVDIELAYRIDAPGELSLHWVARSSEACPVNLVSRAFFNLNGNLSSVVDHRIRLPAEKVLPVNDRWLPLGDPLPVQGTRYDLRDWRPVLARDGQGYEHCFVLAPGASVEVDSGDRQLRLQIRSTLPGLVLDTGRSLHRARAADGHTLPPSPGLALQAQYWPDGPNHEEWPQCVVRPGQLLAHRVRYKFFRPAMP